MITAELPFSGDSVHTIIYKHIYEEPPLASTKRPGIPASLTMAISRALVKEPDQRFPTMEDFATAVWPEQPVASPARSRGPARPRSRATADAPTEITGAPTTPLPAAKARRRRSRAPVVIGLVVVATGARERRDRKSTRLNSSHGYISYAVFCLKKKKKNTKQVYRLGHNTTRAHHQTDSGTLTTSSMRSSLVRARD